MRITLKQTEIQSALVSYVAGLGVGGDAVQTAKVVFTKGRKGNGLTAEIVIGESAEEVEAEAAADEAEVAESVAAETPAAPVEDAFA
jgi:hypothetical protein